MLANIAIQANIAIDKMAFYGYYYLCKLKFTKVIPEDKMNNINALEVLDKQALAKAQPLDQNPAVVYLTGLSKNGRRVQANGLDRIAEILTNGQVSSFEMIPWQLIGYQHAQAIRTRLMEKYKPATGNRMLSALRGVLKNAWLLDQITAERYYKIAAVENITGETIPAGRGLTSGEKNALMAKCEKDPGLAGVRDAAIISLMVVGGLRRAEVVKLDLTDFDPETGKLKVLGKRSKERTTYLTNGALDAMNDWLHFRGDEPGPLFMAINKSSRINNKRMSDQAIYNMLQKRQDQTGIKDFSPHDLRRTFISDLLDAGADIATVAKMAGHSSVNTTARYDRRPERAKQKAAELLYIAYTPRYK